MNYYIVVNEWNYLSNSGREIIGDYDTSDIALLVTKMQYDKEMDNFLEVMNGEIYPEACGLIYDKNNKPLGYVINSSKDENYNMFFRSIIIEREI